MLPSAQPVLAQALVLGALALSGCRTVPVAAARPLPTSSLAPSAPPVVNLDQTSRLPCTPAVSAGDNFCELQVVTPLDDGRVLVVGSFRGQVRLGTERLSSRGMQNALVMLLAPDGAVLWVRQYGRQWHNSIRRLVPLADGRLAVSGIAANGFAPELHPKRVSPDHGFNTERPFVGVLSAQGEWAWIHDWADAVEDLRAGPDGGFTVLDATRWSRLAGDGTVVAQRTLPAMPPQATLVEGGARLGAKDCAWQLFVRVVTSRVVWLVARSSCEALTADWPLSESNSGPPLAVTTSPDGTTLYVAATNTPVADADGVVRAQIRQTLWRLDTGTGVRFAVRTWSPEDGARLAEQRSEPLALLATDDTVDLLVSYQRAASVAGLELPAATALASNGLPRTAVILRLSPRDGSPLRVFVPPPSLGRDLAVQLLADHPVLARAGRGGPEQWLHGTVGQAPPSNQAELSTFGAEPSRP